MGIERLKKAGRGDDQLQAKNNWVMSWEKNENS